MKPLSDDSVLKAITEGEVKSLTDELVCKFDKPIKAAVQESIQKITEQHTVTPEDLRKLLQFAEDLSIEVSEIVSTSLLTYAEEMQYEATNPGWLRRLLNCFKGECKNKPTTD